jgi:hypothetical protein
VTSEELAVEAALSSSVNLKKFWGATTLYHLDDLPDEACCAAHLSGAVLLKQIWSEYIVGVNIKPLNVDSNSMEYMLSTRYGD